MYDEFLAKYTADHLRSHIGAYLTEVNESLPTKIKLVVPKSIDPTSVVGGLFTSFNEILPQYGIDIVGKIISPSGYDLHTFEYQGQINGLVAASSRQSVDAQVKRHGAAVELFIKRHQYLHQYTEPDYFQLTEFVYDTIEYSGAEELPMPEESGELWIAGFSINVAWQTSETGPSDHG